MASIDSLLDGWDNRALTVHRQSTTRELLEGLAVQFEREAEAADDVREMHSIRNAEGRALDHIARGVDLRRRSGESDDVFRLRIMLQYLLNAMDGTMEEIESFLHTLFDAEPGQISFERDFDDRPGTLLVSFDRQIFGASPLTPSQIGDFAESTVPAGHRIELILEELNIGTDTSVSEVDIHVDQPAQLDTATSVTEGDIHVDQPAQFTVTSITDVDSITVQGDAAADGIIDESYINVSHIQ